LKVLVWLLRGAVFIALFGLAVKNSAPVELRFYLDGAWYAPLSLVILAAFAAGAAVGLTEENDAVAIVVSEETGMVSVAVDGALERNITPEGLRARLKALLGTKREPGVRTMRQQAAS